MISITKKFEFEAAHYLPDYNGLCKRLHGHSYKLEVTVAGDLGDNGMVMDFSELKSTVKRHVIDKVDHVNLNDLFANPTAEVMVAWIVSALKLYFFRTVAQLKRVRLYETSSSFVEWEEST